MTYDPTSKNPQCLIRDFIDFNSKGRELRTKIFEMEKDLKFYTEGADLIRKEMSERFADKVFLLEGGFIARPFTDERDGSPKISIQNCIKIPVVFKP